MDPAYLDVSESTGGQLLLFQKSDFAKAGPALAASYTHPATVVRLVGHLNGQRDVEFPVDSTIESFLLVSSVQCRSAVTVSRPSGTEATAANSAFSSDHTAGKVLQVDNPEPGEWKVRLRGTGLFVLTVQAKTRLRLTGLTVQDSQLQIRIAGEATGIALRVTDAAGVRLADLPAPEQVEEGRYRMPFTPPAGRYRIVVSGEDQGRRPFVRTYPVLFR